MSPPYGKLAIRGKNLVQASTGHPVQLHGMSLFWHQWMGQFYNHAAVRALKCSWNCNVVRAAIGAERGGYIENPGEALDKAHAVINAAIAEGIYVVVDWHDENAHQHRNKAIEFFNNISQTYKGRDNIIYEIYNEPTNVSWSNDLKPYHIEVIKAIRKNDPNNVIIVGTPIWSQNVDDAANDPLQGFENIAYTLHYYAGTHKEALRNKAKYAISKNLPIFVTEYGLVNSDGNGDVNEEESNKWWRFLDDNKISYINW
uniref:Glycoside hydrolase family 5 domain-containing protein n=1 Tax=Panagrolaimus sp. JU765 TaxID=591449 RepID=A0AC34RIA3_9BILA